MNRAKELINLVQVDNEREALLQNAKEGMVHDLSYWIRKYKKGEMLLLIKE